MLHFFSLDDAYRGLSGPEWQSRPAWVTIGSFDGVHLGHQAILKAMAEEAHAAGSPAAVITFHPHPLVVLRGVSEPIYLTSPAERARLMGELGIDIVVTLTFDRALASLSAQEFMTNLASALRLRKLWAGDDFALGRNRQGDIATLKRIGEELGYSVQVTGEINAASSDLPGGRISSSRIRELVRAGQAREAASLLGRPYSVEGIVVHGDGRGRTLGFPTANVDYWPGKIVPAFGVYATWTWIGGRRQPSVTSVGVRPTFDNPPVVPRVESFLIDHEEDLYDQTVRVEFLEFLRPELRFTSVHALIDQMILDTQKAKEVLVHVA